jgi:hypothetical protein
MEESRKYKFVVQERIVQFLELEIMATSESEARHKAVTHPHSNFGMRILRKKVIYQNAMMHPPHDVEWDDEPKTKKRYLSKESVIRKVLETYCPDCKQFKRISETRDDPAVSECRNGDFGDEKPCHAILATMLEMFEADQLNGESFYVANQAMAEEDETVRKDIELWFPHWKGSGAMFYVIWYDTTPAIELYSIEELWTEAFA